MIDNSLSDVIDDLRNENTELGTAVDEYLEQAAALLLVLKSIGTNEEQTWDTTFPTPPIDTLNVVIAALNARSDELNKTISTEGSAQARRRADRASCRGKRLQTPWAPCRQNETA